MVGGLGEHRGTEAHDRQGSRADGYSCLESLLGHSGAPIRCGGVVGVRGWAICRRRARSVARGGACWFERIECVSPLVAALHSLHLAVENQIAGGRSPRHPGVLRRPRTMWIVANGYMRLRRRRGRLALRRAPGWTGGDVPRCGRALLALGAALVVAGCSGSAASDGAVPLDELHGSSTSIAATGAAAPGTRRPTAGPPTAPRRDRSRRREGGRRPRRPGLDLPAGRRRRQPAGGARRPRSSSSVTRSSSRPGRTSTTPSAGSWRRSAGKPTIDARQGRTTPEGLRALEQRRRDVHDVAVVLLGHNDAVDPTAYRARIDAIVDELADVPLVLLLTNYEFEAGRDRMNDQLRVVDALHDNVELVDWNAVVRGHPRRHRSRRAPPDPHRRPGARRPRLAVALGLAPGGAARRSPRPRPDRPRGRRCAARCQERRVAVALGRGRCSGGPTVVRS